VSLFNPVRLSKNPIWFTVQGEGSLVGTPSVFLRLAGCDLRCTWCDTPKSLNDFDPTPGIRLFRPVQTELGSMELSLDEVVRQVEEKLQDTASSHVVITGGEPMLQAEAVSQMTLRLPGHITVESNCETYARLEGAPLMSLSPKPERWIANKKTIEEVYDRWIDRGNDVQLKIVAAGWEMLVVACDMLTHLATHVCAAEWHGIQVEAKWLRSRDFVPERAANVITELTPADLGVRLVVQTHPVLRAR
jgi:organic radical activating enzyme